jgi:hypothetical protein
MADFSIIRFKTALDGGPGLFWRQSGRSPFQFLDFARAGKRRSQIKRRWKNISRLGAAAAAFSIVVSWVLSAESVALRSSTEFCQPSPVTEVQGGPKVRLGVSQRMVRPGGVIRIRVENGSAGDLAYGRARVLQRFDGGRWVSLPSHPVLDSLFVVRAGMTSRCESVRVPGMAQAGRYRARKKISSVSEAHKQIPAFGYFRVH